MATFSENFVKAMHSKNLEYVIISKKENNTVIRLYIREKSLYSDNYISTTLQETVDIRVYNYSETLEANNVFFNLIPYNFGDCNIKTFLKAIKKTSIVHFKINAYIQNRYYKESDMYKHNLIAVVDGKAYLLDSVTMPLNSASPVRE